MDNSRGTLEFLAAAFLGLLVLLFFFFAGGQLLRYLNISQDALKVAGGVILFLISVKMIFRNSSEIFLDDKDSGPMVVPIAVPSIAGPATLTTLMILRSQHNAHIPDVLSALVLVVLLQLVLFLLGRNLTRLLGRHGLKALEKLTGLILNLMAVSMILAGLSSAFHITP